MQLLDREKLEEAATRARLAAAAIEQARAERAAADCRALAARLNRSAIGGVAESQPHLIQHP